MPLIIEDGTVTLNANSYVTVEEVREYASNRGIDLPADDGDVERLVFHGMDWFEGHSFGGRPIEFDQPLAFPRQDMRIDSFTVSGIPRQVKPCVCEAAITSASFDLQPQFKGSEQGMLRLRRVETIERQYFRPMDPAERLPLLAKLNTMIRPLIGARLLTTMRA